MASIKSSIRNSTNRPAFPQSRLSSGVNHSSKVHKNGDAMAALQSFVDDSLWTRQKNPEFLGVMSGLAENADSATRRFSTTHSA